MNILVDAVKTIGTAGKKKPLSVGVLSTVDEFQDCWKCVLERDHGG